MGVGPMDRDSPCLLKGVWGHPFPGILFQF